MFPGATPTMTTFWLPRTAPSVQSSDAASRNLGWEEVQDWCNFVLLRPSSLPDGLMIAKTELRPEAPPGRPEGSKPADRPSWTLSNRSAHRCELAGGGRRLRIKQF